MSSDSDDDWEKEFAAGDTKGDTDKTVLAEAVPTEVSTRDTGKYKTLPGFGNTADVQSELAFGRGCAHCTKKVLTAFRLALMASGTHPAIAQEQADRLLVWMNDPKNAELIRVAMES